MAVAVAVVVAPVEAGWRNTSLNEVAWSPGIDNGGGRITPDMGIM
jgi:hypothetical protein